MPQDASKSPKMPPRCLQDGARCPKMPPRCPQDLSKTSQDAPKTAQDAPRHPKTPKNVTKNNKKINYKSIKTSSQQQNNQMMPMYQKPIKTNCFSRFLLCWLCYVKYKNQQKSSYHPSENNSHDHAPTWIAVRANLA